MRKLLFILLLIPSLLFAQDIGGDYYVAPDGDDAAAGTYAAPWATFQKAFDVANAGDTVYFRGGVYYSTDFNVIDPNGSQGDAHGNSGTSRSNQIYYFNYPGETPILDCHYHCDSIPKDPGCDCIYNSAILIYQAQFIHFRGIEVRDVFLCDSNRVSGAISMYEHANLTFENMSVHDIGQRGYNSISNGAWSEADGGGAPFAYDTTYFINCDTYAICDTFVTNPGNAGDAMKLHTYQGNVTYFTGCRQWQYSDDGIDLSGGGKRVFDNCWFMPTDTYAEFDIEGNGIKAGAVDPLYLDGTGGVGFNFVEVRNCIAAFGEGSGFYDLDYDPYRTTNSLYYNNIAWKCGYGFRTNNIADTVETWTLRNNIAYQSTLLTGGAQPFNISARTTSGLYTESNNTFNALAADVYPWFEEASDITVTDSDFLVTDSATIVSQLTSARQADGSLPIITAFHLAEDSDLKAYGTDVGMSAVPDIGVDWAYLYPSAPAVAVKKIYTISGVKQIYWDGPVPYLITVNE